MTTGVHLRSMMIHFCPKIKIKMSKELEDDNAIEIIKKVYQALLLTKERLSNEVNASEDQYGEDKLKSTLDNIAI